LAYGTPFISGKDSLNNEFHTGDVQITIPPTLLISAIGIVPDVRKCVTMDLKKPGNELYLVGVSKDEMGGSYFNLVNGLTDGTIPQINVAAGPGVFRVLHEAIRRGLVVSCHDVSEGGVATALAEMCIAGSLGAALDWYDPDLSHCPFSLFSESNSRFIVEVSRESGHELTKHFGPLGISGAWLGEVTAQPRFAVFHSDT